MARYVWWSPTARSVIESFNRDQRDEFDEISRFIAISPEPVRGLATVTRLTLYGVAGFRYFDNKFPFMLFFYRIDDAGDIQIDLIAQAFVS